MFDNFPFDEEFQNVAELIFMKIQDGRQDGRYMNPMGNDLILGPQKFLN